MGNTQPTAARTPSGELRATGTLEIKDSRTNKNYSVQILQGGVEGDTRCARWTSARSSRRPTNSADDL